MGGGDLNLKKSWHPSTFRNQERVWKQEQKAVEEQRKFDQWKKEQAEERKKQELVELQEQAGLVQRSDQITWMYAVPSGAGNTLQAEKEQYLLGNKRAEKALMMEEAAKSQSANSKFELVANMVPETHNNRDLMAKVREDPLFMIRKREQDSLKLMMANPIHVKRLKEQSKANKEEKRRKRKLKTRTRSPPYPSSRTRSPSRPKSRRSQSPPIPSSRTRSPPRPRSRRSQSPPHSRSRRFRSPTPREYGRRYRSPTTRSHHEVDTDTKSNREARIPQTRPTIDAANLDEKPNHSQISREAKLAEMIQSAKQLDNDRKISLACRERENAIELELHRDQMNARGSSTSRPVSTFQRSLFGANTDGGMGSLAEVLKRNRHYVKGNIEHL